ncbi:hypothetical protein GX50_01780 [[Emmonsia] crescens]|uniref:Uncharacterized protein n=1 Tax=[Emmonsia] crescens TaxID=73230 RepID=A0A2B7ZR22_9EURO|nr:hypothetical protein GX50_01780 [Emmonsia crescens]
MHSSRRRGGNSTVQTITTVQEIRALVDSSSPTPQSPRSKLPILSTDYLSNQRELAHGSSLCLATVAQTGQTVLLDLTTYQEDVDHDIVLNTTIVLSLPKQASPLTLRSLLQQQQQQQEGEEEEESSSNASLDAKLQIGKSLSRTVLSLHTANFVYKTSGPKL